MTSPEKFGAKLTEHYSNILGEHIAETKGKPLFSEAKTNKILKEIFNGSEDIPEEMFKSTYEHLANGIDTGYGSINDPNDAVMVHQLKTNLAVFSAFKSNHYASAMRSLLVDETGTKRTYSDFRTEAMKIDPKYNQIWLAAEYNMATRQARSAEQWQKFQRDQDIYPNLEYMPSRSPNQRDSHAQWYGLILPIDDPFWDTAMPPSQGWGCKCWVRQTRVEITTGKKEPPLPIPGIEGNAGKTGRVFSPSHPFITAVDKADRSAVKTAFQKYRSNLSDVIEMKVGKNSVIISANAHDSDLLGNIKFSQTVVKKFKKDMYINAHAENQKNPEFTFNKTVGDMTKFEGKDPVKYIRNTFEKLKPKNQLGGIDKCFLGMDFDGKLNTDNYFDAVRFLNGKMINNPKMKFGILKNGDNMIMITDKMDFSEKMTLIKKELL